MKGEEREFGLNCSNDVVILLILMRCLESRTGLTREKYMQEYQRTVLLLPVLICAEVNFPMKESTSLYYETKDQHKANTVQNFNQIIKTLENYIFMKKLQKMSVHLLFNQCFDTLLKTTFLNANMKLTLFLI